MKTGEDRKNRNMRGSCRERMKPKEKEPAGHRKKPGEKDPVIVNIYRSLRPLRNRMHLNTALKCLAAGLALSSGIAFILCFTAIFLPIPFLSRMLFWIYMSGTTLSIAVSLFLRPGVVKTLRIADSLGLQERLITAHLFRDDPAAIAGIQREDALKAAASTDFRKLYSLRIPERECSVAAGLAILAAVVFLVPSGPKEEAARVEKVLGEIGKQAQKLEREKENLEKKSNLSEEKLKEVDKKISELLKELKKADTDGAAVKAISRARHELDKLKNRALNNELQELAEGLAQNPVMQDLGTALKNGSMEDIKQKLERLNETMKGLDEEARKKLAEDMEKASKDAAGNPELAQMLTGLGNAAAAGTPGAVRSGTTALAGKLTELLEGSTSSGDAVKQSENEALDEILASLDAARREIAGQAGSSSGFAQGGNGGQQGGSGQQSGGGSAGQGSGNGNGTGDGQGNGQGNGNGSGQGNGHSRGAGGGVGDGTTGKDGGYSEGESGDAGRMPGEKTVRDYEQIYIPDRLGDGGDASWVTGGKNNSGQSRWTEAENIPVERGYTVPYNEVLQRYRDEAMMNLSEAPIPPGMKDIVRDYFTSLDEQ